MPKATSATTETTANNLPALSKDAEGRIVTDSRDVAEKFGKHHYAVLRAIRELDCSEEFRQYNFVSFKIKDLTGESTAYVEMTRDGFAFLAMGFTGKEAARFKEAYIAAFNALEQALRKTQDELFATQEALLAAQAPKVEAFNDLISSEGLYTRRDAAKIVGIFPETVFIGFLREALRWTYTDKHGEECATAAAIKRDLMEMTTFYTPRGGARVSLYLTPKGLEEARKRITAHVGRCENAACPCQPFKARNACEDF